MERAPEPLLPEPRGHRLLLAACAALLFLPGIGRRDLWAPDEPRYAQIAREMVRSGDWIVPRDNQRLYTDKPPLLFWMIAAASRVRGEVTEITARLPIVACSIGTVLLTAALGRIWFGAFGGLAAGLILATTMRGFVSAQWVQTDALLTFFTTLALLGMARILARPGPARAVDLALVHGGIAGALLSKGPIGVILPALIACGWAAVERRPDFPRRLRPWLLALAAAPALAWGAAAAISSAGSYSLPEALRRHALERFAHGLHHPRPAYYFLLVLPLELMPWSIFLAAWALPPVPLPEPCRAGRRQALVWLALPLMFLSLSVEKRSVYLLPLAPAAALLVAGAWPERAWPGPGAAGRVRLLAPFAALLLIAVLALGLPLAARLHLPDAQAGLGLAAALAVASACIAWRAARRGASRTALAGAVALPAALLLGASLVAAPALNPLKSSRSFCSRIAARLAESDRLASYRHYRSAYVFYTGRFIEEIHTPGDLSAYLGSGGAYSILERAGYDALPAGMRSLHPPLEQASVGHRELVLIGSPAAPAAQPGSLE